MIALNERIRGGVTGLLIGDALGGPYEFHLKQKIPPASEIEFTPPLDFQRSHTTVLPGTWSDDGAHALILLASLLHCSRLDLDDLGGRLVNRYNHGYKAVDGVVFDVGVQTSHAISRLEYGILQFSQEWCKKMRKRILLPFTIVLLSITSYAQDKLDISLKSGSQSEIQTKEQLQRLVKTYDLSKWIFTKAILIDEKSVPHSHPVLTLHTRHLKDDDLLLSTFVHEQLHWFLVQKDKETNEAIKELRVVFPKVPVGFPEGSEDEESTYLHLLVNYLEYRADRELLGELRAKQVMDFWATDHYKWVYKTVLERTRDIGNIAFKHKLIPANRA